MFIKQFSYKITSTDLKKAKDLSKKINKMYLKFGATSGQVSFNSNKNIINGILVEYFKTKKDYLQAAKDLEKDMVFKPIWVDFKKLTKKITEQDIELKLK